MILPPFQMVDSDSFDFFPPCILPLLAALVFISLYIDIFPSSFSPLSAQLVLLLGLYGQCYSAPN